MAFMKTLKSHAILLPVNGNTQTSVSGTTTVALRTVSNGMNYVLTNVEIFTDAPATSPIFVQIQVAGNTVYTAYVNNVMPLRWSNALMSIEAASGQQVQMVLGQTSAAQKVAYNVCQAEY